MAHILDKRNIFFLGVIYTKMDWDRVCRIGRGRDSECPKT